MSPSHHSPKIQTKYTHALDLLEDVVRHSADQHTTLLVCSTREDFLDQLVTAIKLRQHRHDNDDDAAADNNDGEPSKLQTNTAEPVNVDSNPAEAAAPPPSPPHHLLIPTLHLLSTSQNVKLVFLHSIPILRAYIAVYGHSQSSSTTDSANPAATHPTQKTTHLQPHILIVNLLSLHHSTSEFTLQGLSRTLASTVSAAHRTNSTLTLVEVKDAHDETNPSRGPLLWEESVPLLSGSVKVKGAGVGWAGRTIEIKRIVGRWFVVE